MAMVDVVSYINHSRLQATAVPPPKKNLKINFSSYHFTISLCI